MVGANLSQEPSIVPVPTVVVEPQVTIPPDLLERLTPTVESGILDITQPTATLVTGFFAVVGALIAFLGVFYAQYRIGENLKTQLGAENRKNRRAETLELLGEALAALEEGHLLQKNAPPFTITKLTREAQPPDTMAVNAARREVILAQLQLLGLDKSKAAFEKAHNALKTASSSDESNSAVADAKADAVKAFKADIEALGGNGTSTTPARNARFCRKSPTEQ